MKRRSLASTSRQRTKGGSLSRSHSAGNGHRPSAPRPSERGASSDETGNADAAATVQNQDVPIFLRKTISRLFDLDNRVEEVAGEGSNGTGEPLATGDIPEPDFVGKNGSRAHDPSSGAIAIRFPSRFPFWKRMLDLSLVLLTVWIWLPIMLLVMCWIKLVSPGPILYRQRRIGFRGRAFMIFKFRSMKVNAETQTHEEYVKQLMRSDSLLTKLDAIDPRLIRLGHLLRTTGLDELPQLFNILQGDMSLVGPRPCTDREFASYLPWQKMRVQAPPGLTGYWQVNGKNKTTFNTMMRMDLYYAKKMSLLLDLKIICQTIPAILGQTIESVASRAMKREGQKLVTAFPSRR